MRVNAPYVMHYGAKEDLEWMKPIRAGLPTLWVYVPYEQLYASFLRISQSHGTELASFKDKQELHGAPIRWPQLSSLSAPVRRSHLVHEALPG
jgi:hypothetical protein